MGRGEIKEGMNRDNHPRYNLSDIYNILYTLDKESLTKILKSKKDALDDETKVKIAEIEGIAKEIGWDQTAISKAIYFVLQNME